MATAILDGVGNDPSDPSLVRRGCAQIRRFTEKPGAFGEPFNRLVAGICKNCGPGADAIYLSWLDPEWRSVGADYFARWSVGPPWCATFESTNPGGCDGCAIKGEGKTPLWWGRQAERKIERLATSILQPVNSNEAGVETPETTGSAFNGFPILGPRWGFDQTNRLCEGSEDKKGQPL